MARKIANPATIIKNILMEYGETGISENLRLFKGNKAFDPTVTWGKQFHDSGDKVAQYRLFTHLISGMNKKFGAATYDQLALWDALADNKISPVDMLNHKGFQFSKSMVLANRSIAPNSSQMLTIADGWRPRFNAFLNDKYPYKLCDTLDSHAGKSKSIKLLSALFLRPDRCSFMALHALPDGVLKSWVAHCIKEKNYKEAISKTLDALRNFDSVFQEKSLESDIIRERVSLSLKVILECIREPGEKGHDINVTPRRVDEYDYKTTSNALALLIPEADKRYEFCNHFFDINDDIMRTVFITSCLDNPEHVVDLMLSMNKSKADELLRIAIESTLPFKDLEFGLSLIKELDEKLLALGFSSIKATNVLDYAYESVDHIVRYKAEGFLPAPTQCKNLFLRREAAIIKADVDDDALGMMTESEREEALEKASRLIIDMTVFANMHKHLEMCVDSFFNRNSAEYKDQLLQRLVVKSLDEKVLDANKMINTQARLNKALGAGVSREFIYTLPIFDKHKVDVLKDDLGL